MDTEPQPQAWTFAEGATVLGADGEKVGQVIAVYADYVVVEKGFFFPTDYYVPTRSVATYDGDQIVLNVTKDEALQQGWDQIPAELAVTDESQTGQEPLATDPAEVDRSTAEQHDEDHPDPFDHHIAGDISHSDDDGTISVEVHEEEAVASTRDRTMGEVRIDKEVVTTEEEIDVPVIEERLRVERRPVDREVTGAEATLEEQAFVVPIRGEVVDIGKDVHVAEEIEVAKEEVERTAQVETTVRHEEVHVDDSSLIGEGVGTGTGTGTPSNEADTAEGDAVVAGEETRPDPDIPEPGMPGDPRNPSVEDEERDRG
jgi:uncharacterized protein (TIGR02271 family)